LVTALDAGMMWPGQADGATASPEKPTEPRAVGLPVESRPQLAQRDARQRGLAGTTLAHQRQSFPRPVLALCLYARGALCF
jgi:hypothetical protein